MELIKKIVDEIELRKNGKYGALEKLSDVELYALAHKFRIKIAG